MSTNGKKNSLVDDFANTATLGLWKGSSQSFVDDLSNNFTFGATRSMKKQEEAMKEQEEADKRQREYELKQLEDQKTNKAAIESANKNRNSRKTLQGNRRAGNKSITTDGLGGAGGGEGTSKNLLGL